MSILNRFKKPIYRQTGGLAGEVAQQQIEDKIASTGGTSLINTNADFVDVAKEASGYYADTANIPQYYTDSTVAGVNPTLQSGYDTGILASGLHGLTTADLVSQRYDMMDPNGAYAQNLSDQAIAGVNRGWGNTGTLGSARNQLASADAANQAILGNTNTQLDAIAGLRDSYFTPSDRLRNIGEDKRKTEQQIIDEDIKRYNYAQLIPQTQLEKTLGAAQLGAAAQEGNVFAQSGGGSGDASAFNEGGTVYANEGMMVDQMEQTAMDAPMPEGNGIMNGMAPEMPMPMEAPMGAPMEMEEEMIPELDRIEMALESLIQASGADVTIKRTTSDKKKKGGK